MTSDIRQRLQQRLGHSYTLEEELGGGGMSRVFVANDTSLGRQVVVKVLPSDMAAEMSVDRFRREIHLAANLQHPHIVPLISAGDMDGLPYFIMPFVKGVTLRQRLNEIGEFPIAEALRVLREMASALAYAHENGIVHRDIKPENVLISGGSAVITDFGVAKALNSASILKAGSLTSVGVAVGTPAYMAPEQGTADPHTDHRADIYALGVIAYEMVAGSPPFSANSPQAMLAAHVMRTPEPISQRRPSVPRGLATLIMACLEKRPSDRPQSAVDVMRQLDLLQTTNGAAEIAPLNIAPPGKRLLVGRRPRLLISIAAGIGLALLALRELSSSREGRTGNTPPAKMLAVLPFENLGAPENAYFSEGMSDEVRGKLAGLPGLMVIARSSSVQYNKTTKTPQQVARELGVQYLLAATVRIEKTLNRSAAHVRVSPELIQIVKGAPITTWQEGFDADITDVFQVQTEIAQRVAQSLDVHLSDSGKSLLAQPPTQNVAAYEAFLRGEEASSSMSSGDPVSLQRAMRFYQRAIALDSTFGPAFARLSQVYATLYYNSPTGPSRHSPAEALAAAEKAVALAPARPDGRLALAYYYTNISGELGKAAEQLKLILNRDANNVRALGAASNLARVSGRWDEALEYARKSQMLDPRSGNAAQRFGRTLLALRRFEEARGPLDLAVALQPENIDAFYIRVSLELARGDQEAARRLLAKWPGTTTELASSFAFSDSDWLLDDSLQARMLTFSPEPFGGDRAVWGSSLASAYYRKGNVGRARAYADSAKNAIDAALRAEPKRVDLIILRARMLAYLGDTVRAASETVRALSLMPISRDSDIGTYVEDQAARIYLLIGQPDKALEHLEVVLRAPYSNLSRGWLRIDPNFAPLRGNARFERIVTQ